MFDTKTVSLGLFLTQVWYLTTDPPPPPPPPSFFFFFTKCWNFNIKIKKAQGTKTSICVILVQRSNPEAWLNVVLIPTELCVLTQELLRFTVGWKTWLCWKQHSPASRVSSETASPLCRKPKTGVSAPRSTLGGATAALRVSTMMLPGNARFKKKKAHVWY